MAERVAARPELVLEDRTQDAGLDPGCSRQRVDLDDLVEQAEIDRDDAVVRISRFTLDPTHDRGSASVGDRRQVRTRAPIENVYDVLLVTGPRHHVGRVLQVAVEASDHVAKRLAVGVRGAVISRIGADGGQRVRRQDAGGRELDLLEDGGWRRFETVPTESRRDRLGQSTKLGLV
jgi:hypothetical protein